VLCFTPFKNVGPGGTVRGRRGREVGIDKDTGRVGGKEYVGRNDSTIMMSLV